MAGVLVLSLAALMFTATFNFMVCEISLSVTYVNVAFCELTSPKNPPAYNLLIEGDVCCSVPAFDVAFVCSAVVFA